MVVKLAEKRLRMEYMNMQRSPPPFIWACPEEKNILDWHFIIRGPPDSPYDGGEYHGLIMFPSDYPFKPPDVKMFTPSGRFEVGHKICMSMTSYHPSTWNAAWSVSTILMGLLSFMLSDEITAGATKSTSEQKKALAKASHAFNIGNRKFRDIFPTYAQSEMVDLPDMGKVAETKPAGDPESTSSKAKGINPSDQNDLTSSTITPVNPLQDSTTQPLTPKPPTSPSLQTALQQSMAMPRTHDLNRHGGRWAWSWRWIVAVVVLAVLGRLSSFVGL